MNRKPVICPSDEYFETIARGFDYVAGMRGGRREFAWDMTQYIWGKNADQPKPQGSDYEIDEKAARKIEKTIRERVGAGAAR